MLMSLAEIEREIEFRLDEIEKWRSGEKATLGSPATGERYALRMREEIAKHERRIKELSAGVSIADVLNDLGAEPRRATEHATAFRYRHDTVWVVHSEKFDFEALPPIQNLSSSGIILLEGIKRADLAVDYGILMERGYAVVDGPFHAMARFLRELHAEENDE